MAKKRSHEEIENVNGPMSSTSIYVSVVTLLPVKNGQKAMFFFDGLLADSTGGVSGNAATKAERVSSKEHSSCT